MPERDGGSSNRLAGRRHAQRAVVAGALRRQRGAPPAVRADRRGRDDHSIQRQPRLAVGGSDINCPPPSAGLARAQNICTVIAVIFAHVPMKVGT